MRKLLLPALALLLPLAHCGAEVPVRTESLVWTCLAFNGRDYSPSFAPESSDTLFLLGGVDNFLSLRKTLVYWWPLTASWKTDTDSLNIQFPGTLELSDGRGLVRTLQATPYTYFNIRGEYELNWKVVTGDSARRELAKYADLYDSYFKAVRDYQQRTTAYNVEMQSLGARIQKLKDAHRDYAPLLQRMTTLPEPTAPTPPSYYEVPPAEMEQAFILNVPPGRYSIRLRDPQGRVMEGSEKTVVVHEARRTGGIGYEVIPSDKWTRPEESVTPSSILYVNGVADLYLRPFFEDEFNDLDYEKTVNNSARGNQNIERWVRIQQVPHAQIELAGYNAPPAVLGESPFTVRQSEGNSLGYTIVPFDAAVSKGTAPNLVAFRIPVDRTARAIRLSARDSTGAALQGSERQIRIVGPLPGAGLLIALVLAPLLAMVVLLVFRARSYSSERITDV